MLLYRKGSHTVYDIKYHIVWITKYRYKVLRGPIQERARELIAQVCEAEDVTITNGVVSGDHIHLHIEYSPKVSISNLVKQCKGRSSRLIQREFPELSKRYWGQHFWAIGYGAWSTGNITDKVVEDYLKHHFKEKTQQLSNIKLT